MTKDCYNGYRHSRKIAKGVTNEDTSWIPKMEVRKKDI